MSTKKCFLAPSQEEIAAYAYFLWEIEGRQSGRDWDYWLQAEAQLQLDRKYEAGMLDGVLPDARESRLKSLQDIDWQKVAEASSGRGASALAD